MDQLVFAQNLGILPAIGRFNAREPIQVITNFYLIDTILVGNWAGLWDVFKHLVLPSVALAAYTMAIIARMTRSSMLEVLNSDYIRTARAKGLNEFWVLYKHALKNAFAPILTVTGTQLGSLLGGAVLTETIFGWPGIGRYIYSGISFRDYPVVQSGILLVAFIFVIVNLMVDIIYTFIDPRIEY
jgi:peptide/nickel transport system permease protein